MKRLPILFSTLACSWQIIIIFYHVSACMECGLFWCGGFCSLSYSLSAQNSKRANWHELQTARLWVELFLCLSEWVDYKAEWNWWDEMLMWEDANRTYRQTKSSISFSSFYFIRFVSFSFDTDDIDDHDHDDDD